MKHVESKAYNARAMVAYIKSETARIGEHWDQPTEPDLYQDETGKRYVVLSNAHGILAVYRVRNDDMLKRLKRWPGFFNEEFQSS